MTGNTKLSLSTSSKKTKEVPLSSLFGKKIPKYLAQLEKANLRTVDDILWVFPYRFERIPKLNTFNFASVDSKFIGLGKIYHREKKFGKTKTRFGSGSLQNLTLRVFDLLANSNDTIELTFFNLYPSQIKKLTDAETIAFFGEVGLFNGKKQIVNPEVLALNPEEEFIDKLKFKEEGLRAVYPTINKVKPDDIKRTLDLIPSRCWDEVKDIVPSETLKKFNLLKLSEALKVMHGKGDQNLFELAKKSLIFHEFFIEQTKLLVRRSIIRSKKVREYKFSDDVVKKAFSLFKFELTEDQKKTLGEIFNDLSKNYSMMRLVQGDVGSGKTALAISASFALARVGAQVAFMCPTEALAIQHFESFKDALDTQGIRCELLTGSIKGKKRKLLLEELKEGKISVLIGTHALIVDDVKFKNLVLTIIDEQHKFGVDQRLRLTSKSTTEHCLIMTATPIPRSLALSQYGDLDVSIIKSMPSNRKGIKSRIVTNENFQNFLNFINTRITLGEQAFVVVPAIEESESLDIQNLNLALSNFKSYFPQLKIEGLHGKMKNDEKYSVVDSFSKNNCHIIVATSVVEVGINIPNASVMAVLNPERFGLSSLHQLRGRVGRGDKPGFFFLVVDKAISKVAMDRLKIIESTTDGFIIAEEDLKIRGEGDLLGKAQSGIDQQKRVADLAKDGDILIQVKAEVDQLFSDNRQFVSNAYEAFESDPLVRLTI